MTNEVEIVDEKVFDDVVKLKLKHKGSDGKERICWHGFSHEQIDNGAYKDVVASWGRNIEKGLQRKKEGFSAEKAEGYGLVGEKVEVE